MDFVNVTKLYGSANNSLSQLHKYDSNETNTKDDENILHAPNVLK